MGLNEVSIFMSSLGFGIGIMLDNFHVAVFVLNAIVLDPITSLWWSMNHSSKIRSN